MECNPGFRSVKKADRLENNILKASTFSPSRLYLVTSDPLQSLPPLVFSLVCVVVFRPERGGLGELLLDSFLLLQNPKTSHDRELLRKVINEREGRGGLREGRGSEERRGGEKGIRGRWEGRGVLRGERRQEWMGEDGSGGGRLRGGREGLRGKRGGAERRKRTGEEGEGGED